MFRGKEVRGNGAAKRAVTSRRRCPIHSGPITLPMLGSTPNTTRVQYAGTLAVIKMAPKSLVYAKIGHITCNHELAA